MIFLLISVLIFNLAAILIPKRLSKIEMYTTCACSTVLQNQIDIYLDIKYKLYWYFTPDIDFLTLIPVYGLYPACNILILNFYPYGKSLWIKGLYALGWAGFLTLYEWGADQSGFFTHHGWKYSWSFLVYAAVVFLFAGNLQLIRLLIRHSEPR